MTALWRLSASVLKDRLDAGATSSVAIVRALQARADETEPHINGFTRQCRATALARAKVLDAERAAGRLRGPLHGLPLTIKDNLDVAGLPTTVGLKLDAERRADSDAIIVAQARAAGAIVLGKSNVPQALMAMHCENGLYGTTRNPRSAQHVTGGSSAGEGALIASGASLMGLGTDLGGSIRFPAAFCGVVGFKPTLDRWSNRGIASGIAGQEFVRAQVGPMGRSVADVQMLMAALPAAAQSPFDRRVPPLPIQPTPAVAGLRIGLYDDDGFVRPAPAMRRAVREAGARLTAMGAEVVPFKPPHQRALIELYLAGISSDALATARRQFGSEPLTPSLKLMWRLGVTPAPLRRVIAGGLRRVGEDRLARVVDAAGRKSVAALWRLTAERTRLVEAVDDAWRLAGLDAVICPASATPAVPIEMAAEAGLIFSYFGRYNVLGMPAGVVPTTRVQPEEIWMAAGRDRVDARVASISARSQGLPVAVQVVAPRWHDPTALAVMAAIETGSMPIEP